MRYHRALSTLSLLTIMSGLTTAEPDLIVSEITSATTFGFADGKMAYSFGTTVCNVGDTPLTWIDNTNEHPVISQSLYRLKDGQLQQIGIGFVRHTTIPLAGNACGLGCTPAGFDALGAGCSDTSASVINGSQIMMGPRSEVNAFTGDFPYPFTSIGQTGDAIYKRLQVELGDVSDPSALYFIETQVITSAETTPETRANNVSYRQVMFSPAAATATVVGPTYTEQPAIYAWRDHGLGIGMPDPDVLIVEAYVEGDGLYHVGSRLDQLGENEFQTTYLIHNQNAAIEMSGFGVNYFKEATDLVFNDVDYHDDLDGLIDNSEWAIDTSCNFASWTALSVGEDDFTNRTRWGASYQFGLTTDYEPFGDLSDGVVLSFESSPFFLVVRGVHAQSHGDPSCPPDMNGDGSLNFFDISTFIGAFSAMDSSADFTGDGQFNFFDISAFLIAFNAGCPCS